MKDKRRLERPEQPEALAAFQLFQKFTTAIFGVSKDRYDRKRAEHDRQAKERRGQAG